MTMSFETYVKQVSRNILDLTFGHVDYYDLPNVVDLAECFDEGLAPRKAARKCLEVAKFTF